jgi:predicted DNA-binding transcriptional regulator
MVSTIHDNGSKFFEWMGLLLLALCVWIWRCELKLTGFGPFSGGPLDQQTPEDYRKEDAGITDAPGDMPSAILQLQKEELEARKIRIMDLLRGHHALNVSSVARDLGISNQIAKTILFILMKEGKIRCDGFPRAALYTLASSTENLAVDHVRELIRKEHNIRSERRFVRVKHRFEVDAVIETDDITFLVEVKYLKSSLDPSKLDDWLTDLLKIGQEIGAEKFACYLALVVFDETLSESVRNQVKRITYDTAAIDTRVLVISKDELEEQP